MQAIVLSRHPLAEQLSELDEELEELELEELDDEEDELSAEDVVELWSDEVVESSSDLVDDWSSSSSLSSPSSSICPPRVARSSNSERIGGSEISTGGRVIPALTCSAISTAHSASFRRFPAKLARSPKRPLSKRLRPALRARLLAPPPGHALVGGGKVPPPSMMTFFKLEIRSSTLPVITGITAASVKLEP